ncbi:MAG: hypothetical protein II969_02180 [Anaerolineaceae bacterium]|nr:hypothetical protein [Anaerolineaceae bacterium]
MLKTTGMLNNELSNYANSGAVIRRMVRDGQLTPVRHGLYETDINTPGICLAMHIYGPSYLSFEFALSYYDLIPEAVTCFTSATFRKHKTKEYHTSFGIYSYRDVPESAYPWGLVLAYQNGYPYMIASPEKAVCDKLYTISPVGNQKEMESLLYDDLRFDKTSFERMDHKKLQEMTTFYRTINHRIFRSYIQRKFIHVRNP